MNTAQKGKQLANWVADQIVEKGIDPRARADGASGAGNREKADVQTGMLVNGITAGIECKNQATLHIPDWWKQTKKLESLGREPILAFKQFGEPLEDSKVIIYLDTFLELIKNQKGWVEKVWTDSKKIEFERAVEKVIEAAKVFQK